MHQFTPFHGVKACRYGQLIYNVNDMYIGRSLDLYGEFSEGEVELFKQVVHPGNFVLDVGANIGAHTVVFARRVGPAGRVYAFEPQRIAFYDLCANMALNNITNVWCRSEAVGAEPGEVFVPQLDYERPNNFGGLGLGGYRQGEKVPVITIDSLDLPKCNVIKVDVEGMEEAVLRGALNTLTKFKPILYVENDRDDRAGQLIQFLDSLGYKMYWHTPPLFSPKNFLNNPVNVFGNIVSKNMFCLHKTSGIQVQETPGFPAVPVPSAETVKPVG